MSKIDELEQMVKRLEPTNGPTVLVDVTFLELKQLLAVVREYKQMREDCKTHDYMWPPLHKVDKALAALEGGE